ncbi:MAG TPA: universal stress protein [Beijerinckiaceae bacterium]|nr:universal stress protein [Beijerinckiaceae bacterium]
MYKKVLVPVDLADMEVASPALQRATALAAASGGELRLVNVLSLIPAAYLDYMPANFDVQERERAQSDLKALAAKQGLPEGKVSSVVRLGAIYHEVLAEAKEWGADLIVTGSHDPTFATYLIGSNAASIVRHAHCSVLVVRKKDV